MIKEINDSESKNNLSDTRVGILYQYTQNFMKLNEIMEFAEKQKQTQLAPQSEEFQKYNNSLPTTSTLSDKSVEGFSKRS